MQHADYRRIPLRNRAGETVAETLVDAADYDAVAQHRWCRSSKGYAVRNIPAPGGRQRMIRLHRVLLGLAPGEDLQGDHVNGDRLDNRRANLRIVDSYGNCVNLHGPSRTPSRTAAHRGVSRDKDGRRWRARAQLYGRSHHLGYFATEQQAADAAAAFRREHMPTSAMDHRA